MEKQFIKVHSLEGLARRLGAGVAPAPEEEPGGSVSTGSGSLPHASGSGLAMPSGDGFAMY